MSGARVAPTIEPVAKMTAELAPVSACAAARRITLDRARASPETSSVTVTSSIAKSARIRSDAGSAPIVLPDYERSILPDQPAQTGAGHAAQFSLPPA